MRFCLLFSVLLTACSTTRPIPCAGVAAAASAANAKPANVPPSVPRFRIVNNSIVTGDRVLAGPFLAIESFDVSESRGEIVFSAKRKDNFDIGLVAVEGSAVKWVPDDPADEVGVQWAPRGNKISYIVRAPGGDLVRTVHIPTATPLSVTFPWARISSLTWDVAAERYTVVYSTPDASDRREIVRYGGEDRAITSQPAARLNVTLEPLGPDAILLRPNDIRYDELVPLVFWLDDDLYAWSDARAALIKSARVAVIVAKNENVLLKEPWMDPGRMFIVGAPASSRPFRRLPGGRQDVGAPWTILADPQVPAGRYRESGRNVAVAPALVQSFAACFIAEQLKRTPPTNGSSR